jgi:hypothetical protein
MTENMTTYVNVIDPGIELYNRVFSRLVTIINGVEKSYLLTSNSSSSAAAYVCSTINTCLVVHA